MKSKRGQRSTRTLHTERILVAMDKTALTFERLGSLTRPHLSRQLVFLTVRNRHRGLYTQQQITNALARLTGKTAEFFYEENMRDYP